MREYRIVLPRIDGKPFGYHDYVQGILEIRIDEEDSARMTTTNLDVPATVKVKTLSIVGSIFDEHYSETAEIGQCEGEIRRIYGNHPGVIEICNIWRVYHLNTTVPETDVQTALVKAYSLGIEENGEKFKYNYTEMCEMLKTVGFYIDRGYSYGSSWLVREIPADIFKCLITSSRFYA